MSNLLDPLPLHARTNERTAQAKRVMIRGRADALRELATTLDSIAADPARSDETMTQEANVFLAYHRSER